MAANNRVREAFYHLFERSDGRDWEFLRDWLGVSPLQIGEHRDTDAEMADALVALLALASPAPEPREGEPVLIIASEISDAIAAHDSGEKVNATQRAQHVWGAIRPATSPPPAPEVTDEMVEAVLDAMWERQFSSEPIAERVRWVLETALRAAQGRDNA